MVSFLEGSLAKTLGKALSSTFLPATLARSTIAAGPNDWTPGAETVVSYTCRAIHEEWGSEWLAGGLVDASERKILILANSLSVRPEIGDRITIRAETFTIVPADSGKPAVESDPALAIWTCRAKL